MLFHKFSNSRIKKNEFSHDESNIKLIANFLTTINISLRLSPIRFAATKVKDTFDDHKEEVSNSKRRRRNFFMITN